MAEERGSLYERLGGEPCAGEMLARLVARFYAGVAADPVLRPLYPEELGPAEERLALFLVQLAGGPRRYEAIRGHPRLRLRHLPFRIGPAERDAWLGLMVPAVQAEGLPPELEEELLGYFRQTASFLVNQGGLAIGGA